ETRGTDTERAKLLCDVKCSGFALDVWVRGDDYLSHRAALNPPQQAADVDLLRPHALQRRERAEQHVKHTLEVARLLDGRNVERLFDHANQRRIAPRVAAEHARIDVR